MILQGTSAIVSGGASGLGAATVRALFERGASVTIADLDESRRELRAQIERELIVIHGGPPPPREGLVLPPPRSAWTLQRAGGPTGP